MTRTEIKEAAQKELMSAMQTAFNSIMNQFSGSCGEHTTHEERKLIFEEADWQMRRVEKLFGYEPGSWSRGV